MKNKEIPKKKKEKGIIGKIDPGAFNVNCKQITTNKDW